MVGSRVIAAVILTTALAGCGNVPQKTAALPPVAAAPPAVPAPPTVTTPPIVIVPPFVTAAPPTTDEPKVSTDQFSTSVMIDGVAALVKPSDGIARRWAIRSDVYKYNLKSEHHLEIDINYIDNILHGYYGVTDDRPRRLIVYISHDRRNCIVNRCPRHENLEVDLDEKMLVERQNTGFVLKVWANNGEDLFLQVSPQQIQKQLAETAAVRQALKDGKL